MLDGCGDDPADPRRHRLQAPFGAPVSGGKNPAPNSKRSRLIARVRGRIRGFAPSRFAQTRIRPSWALLLRHSRDPISRRPEPMWPPPRRRRAHFWVNKLSAAAARDFARADSRPFERHYRSWIIRSLEPCLRWSIRPAFIAARDRPLFPRVDRRVWAWQAAYRASA